MRLEKTFGGKRLSSITTPLIKRNHKDRTTAGARVRANREVAVLKTLFNFAIQMGLYEGPNHTLGIKLTKETPQKLRYLKPDEEYRFLQQLKEPLRTLVVVGIHTGIRIQSEGLSLKWGDIDFSLNLLSVEAAFAKNGEYRAVPLNTTSRKALSTLHATATSDYVFAKHGLPYRNIRNSFDRARKRADLKGITPHVLRHTFASRLVMAGVDLRTVQELGGWKNIGMVMRYAHVDSDHKKQAVERLVRNNSPTLSTTFEKPEVVGSV